jgi:hypothetical protein
MPLCRDSRGHRSARPSARGRGRRLATAVLNHPEQAEEPCPPRGEPACGCRCLATRPEGGGETRLAAAPSTAHAPFANGSPRRVRCRSETQATCMGQRRDGRCWRCLVLAFAHLRYPRSGSDASERQRQRSCGCGARSGAHARRRRDRGRWLRVACPLRAAARPLRRRAAARCVCGELLSCGCELLRQESRRALRPHCCCQRTDLTCHRGLNKDLGAERESAKERPRLQISALRGCGGRGVSHGPQINLMAGAPSGGARRGGRLIREAHAARGQRRRAGRSGSPLMTLLLCSRRRTRSREARTQHRGCRVTPSLRNGHAASVRRRATALRRPCPRRASSALLLALKGASLALAPCFCIPSSPASPSPASLASLSLPSLPVLSH